MAKILVPDYLGQQVLSGIRSLYYEGDTVDIANDARKEQKGIYKTRGIKEYLVLPRAGKDQAGYIEGLKKILSRSEYDAVIPFGLMAFHAMSSKKEELEKLSCMMIPDFEALKTANDKLKASKLCLELGLDTPALFSDYEESDVNAIANEVRYPVAIKARGGSGVAEGLRFARNKEELLEAYRVITSNEAHGAYNPENPLIQEFVPGYIHDACTLTKDGEVQNVLTQVRQIMYPVTGGVGAVNITTNEPELRKKAITLLEGIGWNGPAQVEFKLDPRDGKYKFIELNPKLWGTLDLSIKAGMNFPLMIRDLCMGKKIEKMKSYRVGTRYIFGYRQYYMARQELKLLGKKETIYKDFPYTKTYRDFDWRDPMPDIRRRMKVKQKKLKSAQNCNIPLEYVLNGDED
jgi:predicted ATP-grasp superfamily ATP-dependent carboligase